MNTYIFFPPISLSNISCPHATTTSFWKRKLCSKMNQATVVFLLHCIWLKEWAHQLCSFLKKKTCLEYRRQIRLVFTLGICKRFQWMRSQIRFWNQSHECTFKFRLSEGSVNTQGAFRLHPWLKALSDVNVKRLNVHSCYIYFFLFL